MLDGAIKIADYLPQEEPRNTPKKWIWCEEAAALLKRNVGYVRRRCLEEWEAKGLARKQKRDNGQWAWQVATIADPDLIESRDVAGRIDAEQVAKMSDKDRVEFLRKIRLLDEWEAAKRAADVIGLEAEEATRRFIEKKKAAGEKGISRRTLYDWRAKRAMNGDAGLLPAGVKDDAPANELEWAEEFRSVYLTQPPKSVKACCYIVFDRFNIPLTDATYKAAQRIANAIPKATATLLREGKKTYTDNIESYFDRDYGSINSNDIWCSDHHRFDVQIQIPDPEKPGELRHVRPWLHAWQDVRSRKIVGWSIFITDPNAEMIVCALAEAIRANYAPKKVYLDNGKDFDSRIVQGVTKKQRRQLARCKLQLTDDEKRRIGGMTNMLGIEVQHATPHRGQSKPIERWFRTVCEQFSVRWPTYTGKDTASKPDVLQKRLKAGVAPTLDTFIEAFTEYVRAFNARTGHEGDSMDGRSPDEVWSTCLQSRRVIDNALLDFVKLVRVQVTVNQNAIVRLPGFDVSYGRGERDLIDRIGQKVCIAYNPESLSEGVLLLDSDGSALCRLMHRDKLPWNADSEMLKAAKREQRANMKAAREYTKRRPRMVMSVPELARLADANNVQQERERLRATGTEQAQATIELVKTPIVQSLNSIAQAMNPSQPARIDAESLRAAFTRPNDTPDDEPSSTFSILSRALSKEVRRD